MIMERTHAFVKKCIVATISILLLLLTIEGFARHHYRPNKTHLDNIFEYDTEKSFRLKRNYSGEFANTTVTTSEYGYRGKSFPVEKSHDEWRAIILGDSVTFGHGVNIEDTFAEKYMASLSAELKEKKITVINMGVPGYSSMQEYYDFLRSLQFKPNLTILQFTLNDVTEPFFFQVKLGGIGIDYHNVPDVSFWHFYLSQRSGLYLLLLDVSKLVKFGAISNKDIQSEAVYLDAQINKRLVTHPDDPIHSTQWNEYFLWLKKYALACKRENIPCHILISPYSFQLEMSDSAAYPQQKIIDFSQKNNLTYTDMLPVFRELIHQEIVNKHNLPASTDYNFLIQNHMGDIQQLAKKYFLDHSHLTPLGHSIVSEQLVKTVEKPSL